MVGFAKDGLTSSHWVCCIAEYCHFKIADVLKWMPSVKVVPQPGKNYRLKQMKILQTVYDLQHITHFWILVLNLSSQWKILVKMDYFFSRWNRWELQYAWVDSLVWMSPNHLVHFGFWVMFSLDVSILNLILETTVLVLQMWRLKVQSITALLGTMLWSLMFKLFRKVPRNFSINNYSN